MWPQKLLPIFCLVLIVFALLRCTVRVAMSRLLLSFFFVCVLVGESIKVISAYHSFLSFALVGITWKRLSVPFRYRFESEEPEWSFLPDPGGQQCSSLFQIDQCHQPDWLLRYTDNIILRVEDGPWVHVSALFNHCAVCMYIYMCVFIKLYLNNMCVCMWEREKKLHIVRERVRMYEREIKLL